MSELPEGLYLILFALDRAITMRPDNLDFSLPEIAVKGVKTTSQPKWRITPFGDPGSNLYIITLAGDDQYGLVVKDQLLLISTITPPTQFSIEPAGNGTRRFHIPDQDSVLRLDEEGTQIRVAPADGTHNELWFVEEWHHG